MRGKKVTVVIELYGGIIDSLTVYANPLEAAHVVFEMASKDTEVDEEFRPKTHPAVNIDKFWEEFNRYQDRCTGIQSDGEIVVYEERIK